LNDEARPTEGAPDALERATTEPTAAPKPVPAPAPVTHSATEPSRGGGLRSSFRGRNTGAHGRFAEGARIGGYVLRECIGQGGMARVYRAEHEGLQRQVALKVLLEASAGGDGAERFLREARIAAAIKHRNVVNIFDVGVDRGVPYLAMELLEGADLDTFMGGKNRLDEATTMDIIVPIASALATVHDAGIVHRDMKPGNIFLARGRNDELEPRLLDFGISKSTTEQLRLTSTHGPVLGTPFYMSPEAASGGEMTALSDQYALGVVLYECLTGVHPFAASQNFTEIVRRITSGDYTPLAMQNPQLSRRMVGIVERAMRIDPAHRFADMRAMGRELLLLAGQRTRITWQLSFSDVPARAALVKASSLNATPPVPMVRRRRRRWPYAVPALLALAIAGAWQGGLLQPLEGRLAPWGTRGLAWLESARERLGALGSDGVSAEPVRGGLPVRTLALEPAVASFPPSPSVSAASSGIVATIATLEARPDASELAGATANDGATLGSAIRMAASNPASGTAAPGTSDALVTPPPRRSARRSSKKRASAAQPAPIELGTNNAPIFD
jgi:serine/threonine protein kinase